MPITILFQGDSVTDCGRRERGANPMGRGYASFVQALAEAARPGQFAFLNRGISGNRAKDLRARWQVDCLALRPDVVSILIGINDTWRRYDRNDPTDDAAFETDYRAILEPLRAAGKQLLLITPFLLDISAQVSRMREDLQGKQAVVRRLAEEFGATLLDADALFQRACQEQNQNPADFAADGVHPSEAGHRLLAQAVWETIGAML